MKLGKIQRAWIADLRKYPERQMESQLGKKIDQEIKCCCLGQGLLTLCEKEKREPEYMDSHLFDGDEMYSGTLGISYEKLGLISPSGSFVKPSLSNYSLSQMNDNGKTWEQIADYIESNPENIFTKSV